MHLLTVVLRSGRRFNISVENAAELQARVKQLQESGEPGWLAPLCYVNGVEVAAIFPAGMAA